MKRNTYCRVNNSYSAVGCMEKDKEMSFSTRPIRIISQVS